VAARSVLDYGALPADLLLSGRPTPLEPDDGPRPHSLRPPGLELSSGEGTATEEK